MDVEEQEEQVEEVVEETNEETNEEQEEVEVTAPSQAEQLVALLNNPSTAKSTLQFIASNLGLSVSEAKTEEGKIAIKDGIKQALGDDLAFLGDKLGPLGDAIESLINDRIGKAETKTAETFRQQEAARYTQVIDTTMKGLNTETKGEFNSLMPQINKLMEEMPIGKQTPDQYMRRLYNLAKSEAASSVKTPPKEKLETARRASNQSSLNGTGNNERVKEGSSKNPTYREAIQQAINKASKK